MNKNERQSLLIVFEKSFVTLLLNFVKFSLLGTIYPATKAFR